MSYTTYFNQIMAANDKSLKKELEDNETLHANQAKVIKENYGLEIDSKNQAYDEDLRANEVQKYINMREVAENNANLGLTDSGLNRTQSTAVQLSASNNAAKIERDRNNMVRALEVEMNNYLTEIENSRISTAASIRKGYEDSAMSSAVDMYKADVDAAAKYNDSILAAQEKYNTQKQTDYSNLYKHLSDNSDDLDYCAKLIDEYATLYNIDENGSEMRALLKAAGIEFDELLRYSEKGTVYYTPTEYAQGNSGRVKTWDYNTAGSQNYIVEFVKGTWNWGGGVDKNDKVNIYYPDGTPLASNVQLKNLPKEAALKITKWTSDAKEKDKTTLNMNLAGASIS